MSDEKEIWDCLMIGGGPTALAAAVYTAREDIKTLLIEKGVVGGLAAITEKVDNYPGFAHGVAGLELAQQLQAQAERFGARIEMEEVSQLLKKDNLFQAILVGGKTLSARSALIASGSEWKKLGIEGEAEFYGRGVHNCATCDGAFYRDKKLIIVGGGNSSAQESLFLTKFASQIEVLIRGDAWRASDILVKSVEQHPKITVHFRTRPLAIKGLQGRIQAVEVERPNRRELMETDGVFVFIGLRPVTAFLEKNVQLDEAGFVLTNDTLQTNVEGLFCAGDVRSGATMQIASAVGEGATAALSIRHFLESQKA